ncbi:MAG: PAS domain S-box protein [Acidobacteria bacterium]|nr:PAS domain S-box protein [Acidobacteriota bacterium]
MISLSGSSNWMAITLASDGTIRSLSPNAEQLTGYSAPELVGRPITQILGDRSAFEVQQMMRAAREWGSWEGEIVHRQRGGRQLSARACVCLLSSRGGPDDLFLLLSTLCTATPAAGTAEYLYEVGGRLRMIVHQMNNPLAVMMGFTQLALLEAPAEGKMQEDLQRLHSEMKRVIQAVEQLHSYARSLQEDGELGARSRTGDSQDRACPSPGDEVR